MKSVDRRRLLKLFLGSPLFPALEGCPQAKDEVISARHFRDAGMKGFVIGRVNTIRENSSYFEALSRTRAGLGRIFFQFTKCAGCDMFERPSATVESMKRILDIARTNGIKLVIVGEFPGADQPEFWINNSLRASFVESWRWFAKTFRNDPVIAGLDLLNEPNPPWPGGDLASAHALWRPLAEQAIKAIREEQVKVPAIYEGVAGGSSLGLRGLTPLTDPEVVYSIHYYTPHDITHQRVNASWPRTIPYPAGLEWGLGAWDAEIGVGIWNRQRMEIELRDTVYFQRRFNVPIYVGEFSCVRWAPNKSRERYIADCLSLFRQFGWSWTYHEFQGWPGWDAEIDAEDSAITARSTDAPVMNMLRAEFVGRPI